MASTNKTTHYNLSQYIGTDKPTYLVDYNTDMANIDAGIYAAKAEADTNSGAIGNLSNLETTAKTDLVNAVNEVNGKTDGIGNLSNLTTEAQNNLVSAINEVDAKADENSSNIGNLANLETTNKSSVVGAINEVNVVTPIGGIIAYAGSTAPSKYLICDGSAVSRTTYANLFSIIGTTYGAGDGSTTFNLPNLKGRVIVGYDSSQSEFDSLNEKGGEKKHQLSVDEMPRHNHRASSITGGGSPQIAWDTRSTSFDAAVFTDYTGGDQAHNNLQPYIVLNYIIRAN